MKTRLLENLRKRIFFVIVGIIGYYTIVIPTGLFLHMFFRTETTTSLLFYYIFQIITISFLVGCLYLAFVKVKPSLIPDNKKYRQLIIVGILIIAVISIMIPSGLIVDDWRQGQCIIQSGIIVDGEIAGGSTSYSVNSEESCKQHCEFSGRISTDQSKSCEFKGIFGVKNWKKTPEDFADIENKIGWNYED